MKLEAGKEIDRRCVLGWLIEVYRHPTVAFNTYSDEQQIEFAHDALVLLKEQEAVEPLPQNSNGWVRTIKLWYCGACHSKISRRTSKYCPNCGRKVKWG